MPPGQMVGGEGDVFFLLRCPLYPFTQVCAAEQMKEVQKNSRGGRKSPTAAVSHSRGGSVAVAQTCPATSPLMGKARGSGVTRPAGRAVALGVCTDACGPDRMQPLPYKRPARPPPSFLRDERRAGASQLTVSLLKKHLLSRAPLQLARMHRGWPQCPLGGQPGGGGRLVLGCAQQVAQICGNQASASV